MAGGLVIVAGFGFRSEVSVESLRAALKRAVAAAGETWPDAIATAAKKSDAPGFRTLASDLDLPLCAVADGALHRQVTITQSSASHATYGIGSVAEAAALAAAGDGASLLGPRSISADGRATCALAEGPKEKGR